MQFQQGVQILDFKYHFHRLHLYMSTLRIGRFHSKYSPCLQVCVYMSGIVCVIIAQMYEYLFRTYGVLQDVQEDVQIISCFDYISIN